MKTIPDQLFQTKSPWLHTCNNSENFLTNMAFNLNKNFKNKLCARILRGHKMKNLAGLFGEFSAALQFPYYFGENWNAFDDCIADLDWLNSPGYLITILNSDQLLCECHDSAIQLQSFLGILSSAAEEWARAVNLGEAWDHAGKPFHVIFHTQKDKSSNFQQELSKINWHLSELVMDEP